MTMPLGSPAALRPPDAATADGARPGATEGRDGGRPEADGTDTGTDDRVDGTAQEPSGPGLNGRPGGHDHDTEPYGIGAAEWNLLTDDVRWNAETYLLLGCDPADAPLSLDRLPDRLPEADRPLLRRMMTDALVHGRTTAGTIRVRRADGHHDSVDCAGEPVLGADGTVTALRLLLRSVPDL
ncbi:PAS domain-containing protein [Streptomyces rubellomurinus]|uniref:PAS fold-3 domain-containing protein n=1 Tax=Streptomyces rubellomurinus (strain ATCC 31215) TaxID=359131 RepID=A0A0F2T7Q9_STRR3|nr:PAS domain-containing protein [Streptomyces rubellomurinus]KJS59264.1 hypothetical protein VM95_28215 [Streptomyces rubellomurinus]